MTENANENLETEVKPFTEGDHEIAYRTDSNPSVASGDATRPAVVAPGHGTGRRKQAIARVRLIPGTGEWKINGRTLDEHFPNNCLLYTSPSPSPPLAWRATTTSSPVSSGAA